MIIPIDSVRQLVRRITTASNEIEFRPPESLIPTSDVPISPQEPRIQIPLNAQMALLDEQFHRSTLFEHRPKNYRAGGEHNPEIADLNELLRIIVYHDMPTLEIPANLDDDEKWRFEKALLKAMLNANVSDLEFFHFYLTIQKLLYPNEYWSRIQIMNDRNGYHATLTLEEILKVHERMFNTHENFSQWTYAMKTPSTDPFWAYERFFRHTNSEKLDSIRKFSSRTVKIEGYTPRAFPGAGIIVDGILSPVFPKGHISKRFTGDPLVREDSTPFKQVALYYRESLETLEPYLRTTKFAFFTGFVIVFNEELMQVNGKPYALLIYNDHFENPKQREAFLIRGGVAHYVLSDPLKKFGEEHILNPKHIDNLLSNKISLDSIYTTAGLNEGAIGSTFEGLAPISLHNDIRDCAFIGFALLDLLREAARLYNLGFYFDRSENDWYLDEYKALRELVRWIKTTEKDNEKHPNDPNAPPVLFPFPILKHTISPALVEKCGFVGGDCVIYKDNPKGDSWLFTETVPDIEAECLEQRSNKKWKDALGTEGMDAWYKFHARADETGANLLISDPMYKRIGQGMIELRYNKQRQGDKS